MKGTASLRAWLRHAALPVLLIGVAGMVVGSVQGQSTEITLKIPGFENAVFSPSHTILVPGARIGALEVWLRNAAAEISLSSIRVHLNEQSVSTFAATNPLPNGVRTILRLDQTLNPALRISPDAENMLVFEAIDQLGNRYKARFFLSVDLSIAAPRVGAASHLVEPTGVVQPPPEYETPSFQWDKDLPAETTDELIVLQVTVTDRQGLRRLVIEKNGKDVEEIILENGRPVRKAKGFRVSSKLPGTVEGDGKSLVVSIPTELRKGTNTVVLRAENLVGLRASSDRTIQRTR